MRGLALALLLATPLATGYAQQQKPEWETQAGGTMAFDVASIRLSQVGTFSPPSFPLSPDDSYRPTGGVFSADFPLSVYIAFAYKLDPDASKSMQITLPAWATRDAYTIHARTEDLNPTKDQMRLMVQALLADRFKLVLHSESREAPVLALTLIKPGKTGPKLRPHGQGPPCDAVPTSSSDPNSAVFPSRCDVYAAEQTAGHMSKIGSRNTTLQLLAPMLNAVGRLGRPVVDRTGLEGRWDFTIEWLPEPNPGAPPDPDAQGPTFIEAMHEQLGLKVDPVRSSLPIVVVDRVARPTEN